MQGADQLLLEGELTEQRPDARVGLLFIGSYARSTSSESLALLRIQRPEVFEQLRDPWLLITGIDEFMRCDGLTKATSRVATRPKEIRDVKIEQGDPVFIVVVAANRDPVQFPRPQKLVLDRTPNKHLGFGWRPRAWIDR